MGIGSIALIIIWAGTVYNGVYALVKGFFPHEEKKAEKHDPKAYRKWVRFSGVFLTLCGVLNMIWNLLDAFSESPDFSSVLWVIITVVVAIAIICIGYVCIVKPADKAAGIESDFDKILKEEKEKQQKKNQ